MKFSTDRFRKADTSRNETLFTLGNGNLGFRGDTEEKNGTSHKGTYINGFYDSESILYGENAYGYAKNHETILNLPDPKRIELTVNGHSFDMTGEEGEVTSFNLELDEDAGILTRTTSWNDRQGSSIKLISKRLVSFIHSDCAVISYCVTNTSQKNEHIKLTSYIDTTAENILAEVDPRIGAKFRHKPLIIDSANCIEKDKESIQSFSAHTARSGLFLSGMAVNKLTVAEEKIGWTFSFTEENVPQSVSEFDLKAGDSFTLLKYITYSWDKTSEGLEEKAKNECTDFASGGFEKVCKEQKEFLTDFWNVARINIEEASERKKGSSTAEEALQFNLFHLLQSAGRSGKVSIAAKGLTSEGYEGHFFWDTESYVCPVFTYTAPSVAKKLLEYRASILDKAKERAKEMSLKGALYPWRTISGEETSAYFPAGTAQYHINADIMFALNRYLNAHEKDEGFDSDTVQEMSAETARMYASLGSYTPHKGGAFCINDVTGPDEYTAIVNNNAFTNLMARENLEISAARAGTSASAEEKESWKKAAECMYIPFDKDSAVYPQDDSFMDKAEWDFENTPKENYPLLLHYHPLVIYRHRVLKQPDFVLAQFLLSRRFTLAEKIRNFNFYEHYTTGDSSLSHCIMSIMAAETGDRSKALDYFNKTVRMDIDDVNGNSKDGIHTACMAGSWMGIVYGFAGFRDYGGIYSFNPQLPKEWNKVSFSLAIKGCIIDIVLTNESAAYTLRKGSGLKLTHRNCTFTLASGESKTFSLKKKLGAVLFDLDGVITDTAPLHFQAWKEMADAEGLKFDKEMNKKLLGISREESLAVILSENKVEWTAEKKAERCTQKNERYKELLKGLTEKDILPGILPLLKELKAHNIPATLASSSKNAPAVLEYLGISEYFTAIADAAHVQKAKPEADIFLEAAEKSGAWYNDCVGIEDAEAGVEAIKKGSLTAVGISPDKSLTKADMQVTSTAELTYERLKTLMEN
ncbi:MAG: beta-phosphoglucomutase [Treponema sp.]|nr:beta-phosphoglucomutase [Treponema sp.]